MPYYVQWQGATAERTEAHQMVIIDSNTSKVIVRKEAKIGAHWTPKKK